MQVRTRLLIKFIKRGFDKAADIMRWALRNDNVSNVDLRQITMMTQIDVTPEVVRFDFLNNMPKFRVLPFSPLMEDRIVRREQLVALMGSLAASPSGEEVNWREVTKEIVEMFNVRPSIIKEEQQEAEQEQQMPPPAMGGIPFPGV